MGGQCKRECRYLLYMAQRIIYEGVYAPAEIKGIGIKMKTAIVACRTLEDELNFAINKTGTTYPVEWIESGLHNTPKKLKARLSELLYGMNVERVLLVMGFCGNSIQGIKTGNFELIVPRVDDCISLLIGSLKERNDVSRKHAAYFLTDGWMRGERNIWVEYQYAVHKYGENEAKNIADLMYGHYRTLGILDAGVNPINPLIESTKIIADTLNLEQKVIPASVSYIGQLLTGPWPEDKFIVKGPKEEITDSDLHCS